MCAFKAKRFGMGVQLIPQSVSVLLSLSLHRKYPVWMVQHPRGVLRGEETISRQHHHGPCWDQQQPGLLHTGQFHFSERCQVYRKHGTYRYMRARGWHCNTLCLLWHLRNFKEKTQYTHNFFFFFKSYLCPENCASSRCAVKCNLAENQVEVSGGGLGATYSTLQFHFHWGNTEHHPGSEHMVDGKRYAMEVKHHSRVDACFGIHWQRENEEARWLIGWEK